MYVNLFPDGGALVETTPQATPVPLQLPAPLADTLARLLRDDDQASAVVAVVFLAGVRCGERSLATGRKIGSPENPPGN